jgi:hypothetical protein
MIPAHFIWGNHFYSFLSVQTRVQEARMSGPPESRRTLSRRNHFSSFLPGETGAQRARRSGSPGCTALFEGTSFPHSFRLGPQPWKPRDRVRRGAVHFFSREPLSLIPSGWERSPRSGSPGGTALCFKGTTFPHSLCFTDAVGRTRLPPAVLPLALRRKEIAEFWQYGKRTRRCSDSFRQHPDAILTKVAEETAPLREVPNS